MTPLCSPAPTILFDQSLRESDTFMDSGFHTVDSGFDVLDSEFFFSGDWIPDSNRKQDSLSRIPDYRAQNSGFHDTNFLDSGSHEQKFPGFWNLDSLTGGEVKPRFTDTSLLQIVRFVSGKRKSLRFLQTDTFCGLLSQY